jgi:predicted transcriptional regulator
MNTITLKLSPNLYQTLQNLAKQTGKTPEEMATELLEKDLEIIDDPVEEFIGAFQSNISDWGENHDYYLGQELKEDHAGLTKISCWQ